MWDLQTERTAWVARCDTRCSKRGKSKKTIGLRRPVVSDIFFVSRMFETSASCVGAGLTADVRGTRNRTSWLIRGILVVSMYMTRFGAPSRVSRVLLYPTWYSIYLLVYPILCGFHRVLPCGGRTARSAWDESRDTLCLRTAVSNHRSLFSRAYDRTCA